MSIDSLIISIVEQVQDVAGLEAIVLGGARARGTHRAASDIDLCFYYSAQQPLDLVGGRSHLRPKTATKPPRAPM
jgi:predicted nucleotidyltransferase